MTAIAEADAVSEAIRAYCEHRTAARHATPGDGLGGGGDLVKGMGAQCVDPED
jgi:hypothetical protein